MLPLLMHLGEEGSLSNTSGITIVGIRPYVVSILPVSGGAIINTSTTYGAGDAVYIDITFSAPVVVFPAQNTGLLPTLLLETGLVRQSYKMVFPI